MATIWVISDTHFGHGNTITKFKRADGSPLRDFASVEEMDETMVDRWNAVVRPSDHVWHLGDVTMKQSLLSIVKRLRGHLRLVRGNHDIFRTRKYIEAGFQEILGCRVFDGLLFTHIPVHPSSFERFAANVHGHLHANTLPGRYINVCVEHTNYGPVSLEELKARAARNAEAAACIASTC